MIHLSKAAVNEIRRIQSKPRNYDLKLRLSIQTGGCAGFYYVIRFEPTVNANDVIYNCEGIEVVIDAQNLSYIHNLTLDYSEDLMGGGFRFHNPNALQSCGCGNSFSVNESAIMADASPK